MKGLVCMRREAREVRRAGMRKAEKKTRGRFMKNHLKNFLNELVCSFKKFFK
jgi:hypothetical protein